MSNRLRLAVVLALVWAAAAGNAAAFDLPDPQRAILDPAIEQMAGRMFSQQFEARGFSGKKPEVLPDSAPEVALVRTVTDRLIRVIRPDRPSLRFHVKVVRDAEVNAFCLPGGYVYVFTGLLDFIRANHAGQIDVDELAGVVGHEMAHAVLRHQLLHWQALKDFRKVVEPAVFSSVMRTSSRAQEYEADRYGALYMLRAGYRFSRIVRVFENMALRDRARGKPDDNGGDHPGNVDRARQLRDYMRQLQKTLALWDESRRAVDTQDFEHARECLEILAADFPNLAAVHNNLGWVHYQLYERSLPEKRRPERQLSCAYLTALGVTLRGPAAGDNDTLDDARQAFDDAIRLNPDLVAAHEGAGVVALARNELVDAADHLQRGLTLAPESPGLCNAMGVLRERQGRADEAVALYAKAVKLDAAYLPAVFNQAALAEQQGRADEARALLHRYLAADAHGWWAEQARRRASRLGIADTPAPHAALPRKGGAMVEGIGFGHQTDDVVSRLGPPGERVTVASGTEILRYADRGPEYWVGAQGVRMIVVTAPYKGTVEAAGVGMARADAERALGPPPQVDEAEDGACALKYGARGVVLGVRGEKVESIVLTPPRQAPGIRSSVGMARLCRASSSP